MNKFAFVAVFFLVIDWVQCDITQLAAQEQNLKHSSSFYDKNSTAHQCFIRSQAKLNVSTCIPKNRKKLINLRKL
jgi:hypothetical protein